MHRPIHRNLFKIMIKPDKIKPTHWRTLNLSSSATSFSGADSGFKILDALSFYLSPIFKHFDTQWDKNNIVYHFFWGGGDPPWIRNWFHLIILMFSRWSYYNIFHFILWYFRESYMKYIKMPDFHATLIKNVHVHIQSRILINSTLAHLLHSPPLYLISIYSTKLILMFPRFGYYHDYII